MKHWCVHGVGVGCPTKEGCGIAQIKKYCTNYKIQRILLCLKLTEGVGCTLSSDKNDYSLQRLVAKVEYVVAIG